MKKSVKCFELEIEKKKGKKKKLQWKVLLFGLIIFFLIF